MTDREKLVELIDQKQVWGIDQIQPRKYDILLLENEDLADHLIANGVTVQELDGCVICKDSQEITVTISTKLVDGVYTGWLDGNFLARHCPSCGRRLPNY